MPLDTASPVVVSQVTANHYEITSFEVNTRSRLVTAHIQYGLMVDGVLGEVGTITKSLNGTKLMGEIPLPGENLHDALKRILYREFQTNGAIPSGTVS